MPSFFVRRSQCDFIPVPPNTLTQHVIGFYVSKLPKCWLHCYTRISGKDLVFQVSKGFLFKFTKLL